jgi:pyrroline-5-carboxylate reductase
MVRRYRLGFIGGGNMAEAIIRGLLEKKVYTVGSLAATDVSEPRLEYLRKTFGIDTSTNSADLVTRSEAVLFAVKPQNMNDVMAGISSAVRPMNLFISICAGTRTDTIEKGLHTSNNPAPRVVRVMPNTPALIGLGVAGICAGANAKTVDVEFAEKIFQAVGVVTRVREEMMDAVTALTGSGPAYVFYLIESLIDAGVKLGFDKDQAREMVLQMVLGSATLARQSDKSAAELRKAVTSPGGTTAAGIAVLDERKVKDAFIACVEAAEARGKELGRK